MPTRIEMRPDWYFSYQIFRTAKNKANPMVRLFV